MPKPGCPSHCSALHDSSDQRSCPQVLRGKHLWTMSVLLCFALLCFALHYSASHRYLPACHRYLPASHRYLPASHRYLPASHRLILGPRGRLAPRSAAHCAALRSAIEYTGGAPGRLAPRSAAHRAALRGAIEYTHDFMAAMVQQSARLLAAHQFSIFCVWGPSAGIII